MYLWRNIKGRQIIKIIFFSIILSKVNFYFFVSVSLNMRKTLVCVSLAILPILANGCFLTNVDYKGSNLNAEHSLRTEDATMCQKMCQKDANCYFWTWATTDFFDPAYHKECYLKPKNAVISKNENGLISGPKDCGTGNEIF